MALQPTIGKNYRQYTARVIGFLIDTVQWKKEFENVTIWMHARLALLNHPYVKDDPLILIRKNVIEVLDDKAWQERPVVVYEVITRKPIEWPWGTESQAIEGKVDVLRWQNYASVLPALAFYGFEHQYGAEKLNSLRRI